MTTLKPSDRILKKMGFLSKYEFLGAGCFGGVFKVEDKNGKYFALKMLKATEFNEREWETSQQIRAVNCPYLVEHFNLEHHHEYIYMQLEYANNRTLQELITGKKCGMNIFSIRLMWQMLTGVGVLHKNKIIHRDLKADNILCSKNDNGEMVIKISDFGLARTVSSEEQAKTQCGTPLHMAPEIFVGVDYGTQADVWSLGVLFFQMAANGEAHPFPAQSFPELLEMINTPLVRDTALFPAPAADPWWDVVEAMLCVRMKDRAAVHDVLAMPLFKKYRSENDFPTTCDSSSSSSASSSSSSPPASSSLSSGNRINKGKTPPEPPLSLESGAIVTTFPPCTYYYLKAKGLLPRGVGAGGGGGGETVGAGGRK